MSKIEWNKPGARFFEAGVDRGVFYPRLGSGVAWNGLVSVNEDSSGGDLESLYFDGVKYHDLVSGENFSAQVDALSVPAEFTSADGMKTLSPGLYATQQPRATFGLSYRTLIGNDLVGSEYGYKIHLVYNCTAAPTAKNNQTISAQVNPISRSWSLSTVPPPASTFRPTAHLVVDSTKATAAKLANLENALYGTSSAAPYLPSVAGVISILS